MFGFDPLLTRPDDEKSIHTYTNKRVVVDATTGWSLFKIFLPYSELEKE